MKTHVHICQSVSGALKTWSKREWEHVARENKMSVDAVKEQFRIWQFEGKRVVPIGEACKGFSFENGCPGHKDD